MVWSTRIKKLKNAGWTYVRCFDWPAYTHYSNVYFVNDLKNMDDDEFMIVIEEG